MLMTHGIVFTWQRTFVAALALLVLCLGMATPTAHAQPTEADKKFEEGRKKLAAGDYAEACRLFAASQTLDPAIGTLLNLGECTTKQDKPVEARKYFFEAEAMALARGDAERAMFARKQYDLLAPRVGMLFITVDQRVTDPKISVDGEVIDLAVIQRGPLEVLRGPHTVSLHSGSELVTSHDATVDGQLVTINLEPKAPEQDIIVTKTTAAKAAGLQKRTRSKTGLYVAIGGAAVFAGGVGLAFSAKDKYDDARKLYDTGQSRASLDDINDARKTGNIATIISVAGLAAIGTGTILYFISGKSAGKTEVALVPTIGGASAMVSGRW